MADGYYTPGTQATLTWTLASLASDTNLLNGRQSTFVTSGNWIDAVVSGVVTTGTSPTADREIRVYVLAQRNDTPTYPAGAGASDAALNIASTQVRDSAAYLARVIGTNNTSNVGYEIRPFSLLQVCGFVPKRWCLWLAHSTGVALNATAGNHQAVYLPYVVTSV